MDKKYLGATLPLSKVVTEYLDSVVEELTKELGFSSSRADAVAYLVKFYYDKMGRKLTTRKQKAAKPKDHVDHVDPQAHLR